MLTGVASVIFVSFQVSCRVSSQRVCSSTGASKRSGLITISCPGSSDGSFSISASLRSGARLFSVGSIFLRSCRVVNLPRAQVPNWAIAR